MLSGDIQFHSSIHDLRKPSSVVVIGAGTGGPQALIEILPRFQVSYRGAIIVIQQMRAGFTRVLSSHLNDICHIPVREPVDGQDLRAAEVLMVPGGSRLTVPQEDPRTIRVERVEDDPEALGNRVDKTMASVAAAFGRNAVGILLTGLGEDGRDGMRAIADAGGTTIAQDEESSTIFDLPASAIHAGVAHHVLPLWNIADQIISLGEEVNANAA